MQRRQLDQVAAAVLVVFSALVYFILIPYQIPPDRMGLSSSFFPKVSVIAIGGLGLLLLIKSWLSRSAELGKKIVGMSADEIKRAALIFCLMLFYVVALKFLGFFISTPLFLGVMFYFCGQRRAKIFWPIVILLPAFIFLIFEYGMKLILPRGIFG